MERSKVYFTDFHTIAFGDGLPTKLKKLIKKAGISELDMDGKFVATKCILVSLAISAISGRTMPRPLQMW